MAPRATDGAHPTIHCRITRLGTIIPRVEFGQSSEKSMLFGKKKRLVDYASCAG